MRPIASSILLLFALIVLSAAAPVAKTAKTAGITLSTHLDKTAMWVGDTVRYTVKAVHDPDVEFILDQLKKESLNLAPFLVRDISARQGSFGNKKITEVTLLLTTYESGQVELRIPSFVLYYFRRRPGVEKSGETLAESFPVPATKVGLRSTLTADNLRPRDNREIWQINPQRWIVPFALGLAGMAFVLIQLGRRVWASSREERPMIRRRSRRARQRMLRDFVRKAQGIGRESTEDQFRYYGEVSQFVRSYLSESLEIDASGLTPEEMESALKNRGQNGLSAPVKTVLERCEQVLYSPQGSELGKRWRDEVQEDLGKIADRARG
jgi:hypothetical protein